MTSSPQVIHRLLTVAALIAFSTAACAATINVPSMAAPTIQSGINAAQDGDTVVVAAGATYSENIDFMGKAITVMPSTGGTAATIIDGRSLGPTVTFKTSETNKSVLTGFTIRNGGAADSSGTVFNYGGISISNAAPSITGNTITHNNCFGIVSTSSAPIISGNEISDTQTPKAGCGFTNGSGIFISNNLASDGSSAIISGNTIENNAETANSSTILVGGAGIAVYSGSPLIINNTISKNSAPYATGGGIDVEGGQGVEIVQNLIYNNQAGCGGGAIAFKTEANSSSALYLLVQNNTIVNNTGPTTAPAAGCVADAQLYPTDDGYSYPVVVFLNNIITGNTAAPATSCYEQQPNFEYSQSIFDHNVLYNPGGSFFGPYCIDVSARYGNVAKDPLFNNAANGDFTLQASPKLSPAIDAGNNSLIAAPPGNPTTVSPLRYDFAGNARIVDATGKGYPVIDIGAYESAGQTDATPTTTVVSTSAPRAGRPLVITAVVSSPSGTPTGTATFFIDSVNQTTTPVVLDSTGTATFRITLPVGAHSIYAVYSGAGVAFPPSVSVVDVIDVEPIKTSVSITATPNPALIGQNILFTVTTSSVDPTYNPTPVNVYDTDHNNTLLATVMPDATTGIATFNDATLSAGLHTIVATFPGTVTYSTASSGPLAVRVTSPTTLSLVSGTNPAQAGVPFTITATIDSTDHFPSGSINFFSDNVSVATGTIVVPPNLPPPGFGPPPPHPLDVSVSISLPGGTHNLVAKYPGDDASDSSVSNTVVETVLADPTTLTLTSATPNPALAFQTVTLSAHIVAANSTTPPTGSISFLANGSVIGTGAIDASGNATLTNGFAGGTYSLTASYAANTSYAASSSGTITEVVNKDATSATASVSPNPGYTPNGSVTLSAAVVAMLPSPSSNVVPPTGAVTFYDNGNLLSTASVTSPSVAITSFTVGSHTITAVYSGDSNYLPSTSAPVTLNILLRDFTLTADPSITIPTTGHNSLNVMLASIGGFNDTVTLTCSNLPQYASCNFPTGGSRGSVQLAADATVTATIDIDTDALLNFASLSHPHANGGPGNMLAFALLLPVALFVVRRPSKLNGYGLRLLIALFALALAANLTGCSGHLPGHTPPGSYSIAITATGNSTGQTHTANVTLIVTQ